MKRIVFCLFILFLIPAAMFSASKRISINDLVVNSKNSRLEYVGKGIAEMVAVELIKSRDIFLIEREKRTKLLEEAKFSLSGLADSESQVQLGRLLAADFMVFGDLIEMDKKLLITMKMVSIETGEIVWADKLMENLDNYEYISSYFAGSILRSIDAEVAATTIEKVEVKETKSEEVVLAFSKAIYFYDNNETEKAREELDEAKRIDPMNEATQYFLNKLATNTAKFKVMAEPYVSYQNPAYLGIIKKDRLFFGYSGRGDRMVNKLLGDGSSSFTKMSDDVYLTENPQRGQLGYYTPFFSNWGLGIEVFGSMNSDKFSAADPELLDYVAAGRYFLGAIISTGIKLNNAVSLGLGISLFNEANTEWYGPNDPETVDRAVFGLTFGFIYCNSNETFVVDSRLGYSNATYDVIDVDAQAIEKAVHLPLLWENTLTLAFNEKRTFLVTKQVNDIYFDTNSYFIRFLPLVEHFVFNWLSLRAGVEDLFPSLMTV